MMPRTPTRRRQRSEPPPGPEPQPESGPEQERRSPEAAAGRAARPQSGSAARRSPTPKGGSGRGPRGPPLDAQRGRSCRASAGPTTPLTQMQEPTAVARREEVPGAVPRSWSIAERPSEEPPRMLPPRRPQPRRASQAQAQADSTAPRRHAVAGGRRRACRRVSSTAARSHPESREEGHSRAAEVRRLALPHRAPCNISS